MTSRIDLSVPGGELWWGGAVVDGLRMPFPDGYRADLHDLGGNQGMPALVSSAGRSVWSDRPFVVGLRDGVLSVEGEAAVTVRTGGETLAGAYRALAAERFPPTGRLPDPLLFTAPQYNLWIETLFEPTQEKVERYARDLLARGFPPGVLMIDDSWHETYGGWTFHTGRFPDPRTLLRNLHDLGFKVMLWVVPYVTADSPAFRALRSAGLLVTGPDGRPAIGEWWNGHSASLDLVNPAALEWFASVLADLRELGVDGFKFDGGDAPFYARLGCADPSAYPVAWNRFGVSYALNEFRDAWRAAGLPLAQRQRDKFHTWSGPDGLESLLPNAIAQSITGHAYVCPDMIGGGEYESFTSAAFEPELFVRSAQASALMPMMQFSAAPWRVLPPELSEHCRDLAVLHTELGPEILALAAESARTGDPILRPLEFDHPSAGYARVIDQFLLGPDILVAPVLTKGATSREVVLPPGSWRADDGALHEGPTTIEVAAPLTRLPWFRRAAG